MWLPRMRNLNDSGLPPYVWIKPLSGGFVYQDAGFLGPQYGALAFGDGKPPDNLLQHPSVSDQDLLARTSLRKAADQRYAREHRRGPTEANGFVYDMALELMKRRDLFDTSTYSPRDVERYGPALRRLPDRARAQGEHPRATGPGAHPADGLRALAGRARDAAPPRR